VRSLIAAWIVWALLCLSAAAQSNPVPLVYQPLVPESVNPGSGPLILTVNGSGFTTGSVVEWNGSPRTTTFISSSQLTAAISASDVAKAGTAAVTVVNPGAQAPSNAVLFPVTLALPLSAFAGTVLTTSGNANAIAPGDLNNDGFPDMALCLNVPGMIALYKGAGNGQFTFLANYKVRGVSAGCQSLIMADLNGDHNLDVIVSNSITLVVFLGNGDGTLQPKTNWNTGGLPTTIVAADLNHDGKLDLATSNFRSGTVSVLLGNGDGTFQPKHDYGSVPFAQGLVAGDFNRDGILDLAASSENNPGNMLLFLGNGDGTLQPPLSYPAGSNPGQMVAGDLNGDGKLDLFIIDEGGGTIVLLGNGDGTFQPFLHFGGNAFGTSYPVLGDVNGDGKLDAVFPNHNSGLQILYGNGDGTFQTPFIVGNRTGNSLAAADVNGDGMLDFVFVTFGNIPIMVQTTDALNPGNFDFGSQKVGSSSQKNTTLLNFGFTDITIQNINVTGTNKSDFVVTSNCGTVLLAGQSCTLTVTFTPSASGDRSAMVVVKDSAPGPLILPLFGFGT
jgi:VCBS repeat protein/HYDIN/CFA65/VesB family protein/FG-GAP repeat protein